MALTIATNNAALNAAAAASSVNRDMETSMARLSSGKRINSASDDAAGVAISSRLTSNIRGTDQAIRNALDGQALIDTAEGAHKEIENILQRMREIAVQAANDTNNDQDRANLQAEMDALSEEINRIAGNTTWAGTKMLDAESSDFSFHIGAGVSEQDQVKVSIGSMTWSALRSSSSGSASSSYPGKFNTVWLQKSAGQDAYVHVSFQHPLYDGSIQINGTYYNVPKEPVNGTPAMDANLKLQLDAAGINTTYAYSSSNLRIPISYFSDYITSFGLGTETGDSWTFVGDPTTTEGDLPGTTSYTLQTLVVSSGTGSPTLDSPSNAMAAISVIDTAINAVNIQRSKLGAVSNRLSHTVNNLTNISSNLSAAQGGIEDADFAKETTDLAKNQILQQASTAMLAQANASKQNVLSLLQG
jgi:flagellin